MIKHDNYSFLFVCYMCLRIVIFCTPPALDPPSNMEHLQSPHDNTIILYTAFIAKHKFPRTHFHKLTFLGNRAQAILQYLD